jgi:hypothetical protein
MVQYYALLLQEKGENFFLLLEIFYMKAHK